MHRHIIFKMCIMMVIWNSTSLHAIESSRIGTGAPHSIMLSPRLNMRAGSESILTAHATLALLEDRFVGTQWMKEQSFKGKALDLTGRVSKLILLDVPMDYFMVVLLHEYIGHGDRYRELGITNIDYGYDLPPPYGDGGGQASTSIGPGIISGHEEIAIWTGGLESHQTLNSSLRQRWMVVGEQHYREALTYFWSFQISLTYIQDSEDLYPAQQNYNDPQAYINLLNMYNGYADVMSLPFSMDDLKRAVNRNALDPMLFFSLYNGLIKYLWSGDPISAIPMLEFGPIKYLPSIHVGLTPFGVETHLENYLIIDEVLYRIVFSKGDETFHSGWGGFGAQISYPFAKSDFSMDVSINLWKQPALALGGSWENTGGGLGGSVSCRSYFKLPTESIPVKAVVELGYKSAGFLEGYALNAGPIILFGVQL
ncbi:MAG: hypothetical protein H8E26_14010 [FCB group bacterium]|nr:hypothetical protein [FCB group bacterium]MBL7029298.1 hypothetical protein [Candidatus Neomarinimicrobiota bacterium]MBL7122620.1 hypothetical protein [Candidatus Neomarinimicrobiota bacterium]